MARSLLDKRYPGALKVRLLMDKLNTHDSASPYDTFPPTQARRLAERLEIPLTPRHVRWLNSAGSELSALAGQCLPRRLPDSVHMQREVAAWQRHRNQRGTPTNWRFTTKDALINPSCL